MLRALQILIAFALAIGGGMVSAGRLIDGWPIFGAQQLGAWRLLPDIGRPDADPYTRAYQHRVTRFVLGPAEGLTFIATVDDSGVALDPRCNYRIAGEPPLARLFTFHAETPAGALLDDNPALPSFLHSDMMMFGKDSYTVTVGPDAAAGNWLAVRSAGPYRLVMTQYDTAIVNAATGAKPHVPTVTRLECRDA